jgi:hypothetical protein
MIVDAHDQHYWHCVVCACRVLCRPRVGCWLDSIVFLVLFHVSQDHASASAYGTSRQPSAFLPFFALASPKHDPWPGLTFNNCGARDAPFFVVGCA